MLSITRGSRCFIQATFRCDAGRISQSGRIRGTEGGGLLGDFQFVGPWYRLDKITLSYATVPLKIWTFLCPCMASDLPASKPKFFGLFSQWRFSWEDIETNRERAVHIKLRTDIFIKNSQKIIVGIFLWQRGTYWQELKKRQKCLEIEGSQENFILFGLTGLWMRELGQVMQPVLY